VRGVGIPDEVETAEIGDRPMLADERQAESVSR
jgi:hypothetical protein